MMDTVTQSVQTKTHNLAERIAIELGTRSNDGMSITNDATIQWITVELFLFLMDMAKTVEPE